MTDKPVLLWLRRDFRLHDHPAMTAAAKQGVPVIPVFIHDALVEGLGAAPKWRLGLSVAKFSQTLAGIGSRLILRRGDALDILRALIDETGAGGVHWSRAYDPASIKRDTAVKSALKEAGIKAFSHRGHLLFEPWTIETQQGGPYKVYSPYWRAVKGRDVSTPLDPVSGLRSPANWPKSETLNDWAMGAAMRRGAEVVAGHARVGEEAARDRLWSFLEERVDAYKAMRDFPATEATSRLSENLTYGEISPRVIWHAGLRRQDEGAQGAGHFLQEVVWREFAWHLFYHFPQLDSRNWREAWNDFPWRHDNGDATAWKRARTGEPLVDAAMREMFVTGTMHNRARMIVASYLTKHLLTDWRVGLRWFEDCLIDWDPASNAMGWQWVAGCGPDAAPYFRVFNPEGQAAKFDPEGRYLRAWLAEGQRNPPETAQDYFRAIPASWRMAPDDPCPERRVALEDGRAQALAAYKGLKGER